MNDDLSLYIDDILNALSDSSEKEVSREEVEKELKKFIEYGVPLDHAKQTLIKKFGGSYTPPSTERVLVADLESAQYGVHVLCRVLHISPKDITVKGENKKIFYGILGDESGSIPFTAWNDFELEKGDVVEISNAYTREWQGETKLNSQILNTCYTTMNTAFISLQCTVTIRASHYKTRSSTYLKNSSLYFNIHSATFFRQFIQE